MSIESVMPSSHLILCRPLLLLLPIPPSIRVFSNESALPMRWPKYWSFSFNISPSNEHPGLICFRMDWLVLLAVQGTLNSLFQHHSSKASILWRSAFFTVQLSHPYMTTVKTIALTRRTFVGKVTSLLLNMLSRLVITFLPRSKHLNFMAAITNYLVNPTLGPFQYFFNCSFPHEYGLHFSVHFLVGKFWLKTEHCLQYVVKVKSLSHVRLFVTPWTVAHQAPLSMGFSRQEYWSGLPFPSPGDLPDPGIEPRSPAL